jgi:hypothetical protein
MRWSDEVTRSRVVFKSGVVTERSRYSVGRESGVPSAALAHSFFVIPLPSIGTKSLASAVP